MATTVISYVMREKKRMKTEIDCLNLARSCITQSLYNEFVELCTSNGFTNWNNVYEMINKHKDF